MSKRQRIIVSIIMGLSLSMTAFSTYIYTTEPGLHFLVIIYLTIGNALLGLIGLLFIYEVNKRVTLGLGILSANLLTLTPILVDQNLSDTTTTIGTITSLIGCIIYLTLSVIVLKNFELRKTS